MKNKNLAGHITAVITILIWGTTFISTKVLLRSFAPVEILFIRFLVGYLALWLVHPHPLQVRERRHEGYFAAAGLCGVTLYFLLENIALTLTMATNVGVIISIAPFFTAIFAAWVNARALLRTKENPKVRCTAEDIEKLKECRVQDVHLCSIAAWNKGCPAATDRNCTHKEH